MLTRTLLSLALLLTACDAAPTKGAPQVATTPTPAATTPATPAATPAATPVAPPVAKPRRSAREQALASFDKDAAREQARSFRDQLAAGRTAVKAKDYAAGVAAFTAALKIDPNHPAALAELGWAAYLAGDLASAQRHTERAIASDAPDRTRGAALYNLGRILEDRADKDAAAAAYQHSLQLRPNDVVSQRLAGLTTAGADPTPHECDLDRHPGAAPADLCAALFASLPADDEFSGRQCAPEDTEPGEVAVDAAGTPAGGEPRTKLAHTLPDGVRVAVFRVDQWMVSGGSIDDTHLAILYADRWYTAQLGSAYNPGVGYIGADFSVDDISLQDLIPGGRPELVITTTGESHDGDYGDNVLEGTTRKQVAILGLDGDAPRWLGAFTLSSETSVGPMIDDEPTTATATRSEGRVDFRLNPATSEVELFAVTGVPSVTAPGRFKLGALPAACPAALGFTSTD